MVDIYNARIHKLRRGMRERGLDLLLIYSDGQHSFFGPLAADGVRWLSGFKPLGPHAAVLLPKDGEPTLIFTPAWDRQRAEKQSWIPETIPTDDFTAALASAVRERRLSSAKAGLLGGGRFTRTLRTFVHGQFRPQPAAFDEVFDDLTKVRDELELELSRQAADIAERGYEHLLKTARPGLREYELAAELDRYMKSLGADDNFLLMSASRHNYAVKAPGDRRLDGGDVILGEISPSVRGQFVQICRTIVLGDISTVQREKYQMLIGAMFAGMKAGKPGTSVRQVVETMNEVVTRAGYGKYCFPPYMRVRGHGMGLGSVEPGDLMLENHKTLEAGMTFVLHPNQYVPETGYLMVGEPITVTENGMQPFTQRQPALDSIAI